MGAQEKKRKSNGDVMENQCDPIFEFQGKYRFLSNFWLCPVCYDGMWYSSSEHAYQAAKSLDLKVRREIRNLSSPGQAKKAGQKIIIRPDWEDVKRDIMLQIVTMKFLVNNDLRERLMDLDGRILVEGNSWGDNYWGSCPVPTSISNIKGQNHLGQILMDLMKALK